MEESSTPQNTENFTPRHVSEPSMWPQQTVNGKRTLKQPHRVQFLGATSKPFSTEIPDIELHEHASTTSVPLKSPDWSTRTNHAAQSAQKRAKRLESKLSVSAPGSPTNSDFDASQQDYFGDSDLHTTAPGAGYASPPLKPLSDHPVDMKDIPLVTINTQRPYDINEDTTDEDSEFDEDQALCNVKQNEHSAEARRLVRTFTNSMGMTGSHSDGRKEYRLLDRQNRNSGTATPAVDKHLHDMDYIPPPEQYKPSVLSSILFAKLANYEQSENRDYDRSRSERRRKIRRPRKAHSIHSGIQSPEDASGLSSGRLTPSGKKPKWYDKSPYQSLPRSSASSTATLLADGSGTRTPSLSSTRPAVGRTRSSGMIATAVDMITHPTSRNLSTGSDFQDHVVQLELQLSDILARRRYLIKLCKALMIFGAPTHRLEEYMNTSARKLLVQGSFQYLPNCMIIAFDDPDTHTTEVHLVKENAAIDLGKFKDVYNIYKNVIHDKYTPLEAFEEISEVMDRDKLYPNWLLIMVFGVAAVSVGPFAFGARPIDLPICFFLGSLLGYLQLMVAPRSAQFSHVFEILATVIISFAARGFGSITRNGSEIFCFSAIAQSSIALILPGWIILCAALELQSRNLIAGSIRMVYAIIYTLFLGFGILIGTTLMGMMNSSATDKVTCSTPTWWDGTAPRWHSIYVNFVWVPIFTICLAMVNQARWRQMLPMTVISLAGYATNYFASMRFAQNIQLANACGAFVIGALANLYSRFFHGLAAATMLPAIFVQVPSGLAASGSLVAGLTSANQITRNSTGISVINNGTQGFLDAQTSTNSGVSAGNLVYGGTIFNVGYGMVQVAIGISVGLFLSALFIYPFGKRRSGLFSF